MPVSDASGGKAGRHPSTQQCFAYNSAANQGFAQALCNLGNLFFTGDGVDQSHTEAARLFQTAVVMETPPSGEALFKLGLMHEHGIGVPASDLTKAMQYYSAAARVGNEHAPGLLRALQEKQK